MRSAEIFSNSLHMNVTNFPKSGQYLLLVHVPRFLRSRRDGRLSERLTDTVVFREVWKSSKVSLCDTSPRLAVAYENGMEQQLEQTLFRDHPREQVVSTLPVIPMALKRKQFAAEPDSMTCDIPVKKKVKNFGPNSPSGIPASSRFALKKHDQLRQRLNVPFPARPGSSLPFDLLPTTRYTYTGPAILTYSN